MVNIIIQLISGAVAETKIVQAIAKLLSELIVYGDRDIKAFFDAHTPFNDLVKVESRLPRDTIATMPTGFDRVIPDSMDRPYNFQCREFYRFF